MANEIQYLHDDAAEAVYCIIRNASGAVFDAATDEAFEIFDTDNWADYAIALTQVDAATAGNVAMTGDFPSAVAVGFYRLDFYLRAGASPGRNDVRLAGATVRWDGAELTPAEFWAAGALRAALAVLAGNMSYDEADGEAVFLDAEDGSTPRVSYKVSATSVGRTEASVS